MTINGELALINGEPLKRDSILKAIQKHTGVGWFNNNWRPAGMVSYAAAGGGNLNFTDWRIEINSGATAGGYCYCAKDAVGLSGAFSWGKRRYFGVYVDIVYITNQIIHVVSGGIYSYLNPANTWRHIGFKVLNNALYGTVADETTEATLLLETLASTHVLRRLECVFTPGVECRFYVGGVNKGALVQNLPTGSVYSAGMLKASINNTQNEDKNIYIYESRTLQVE